MRFIASRENSIVRQLVKLQKSSRYRKKMGTAILDGIHLIQSYLATGRTPLSLAISQSGKNNKEIESIVSECSHRKQIQILYVSDSLFQKISPSQTPIGILACIAIPEIKKASHSTVYRPNFCILLESIQDPGNLGTILRSAAAANVTDSYLSADSADAWSPKTLRAAMGAHFVLAIHSNRNLVEIADNFSGQVLATSPSAPKSLFQFNLTQPTAFVFGNEGQGLTKEMLQVVDDIVSIPIPGQMESLNVAAAATICMYEKVRQELQVATL